jgi:hypothetical protein
MAEAKAPRGKEPAPRKQEPVFSHSPDADAAGAVRGAPAGMRRPAKAKQKSWFQRNQMLVIISAIGVVAVVVVVVLGIALGWFGGGSSAKPAAAPTPVAAQPAPPQTPPAAPSQPVAAPSQPTGFAAAQGQATAPDPATQPGQTVPPGQTPSHDVKKEAPKIEQKPLLEDIAKWKPDDYFRARRENDPKLLPAVVRLGEKFPGNEKAAKVLVALLKPLPPEEMTPPAATPTPGAPGTPVMPGSPAQPGMAPSGPMPQAPGTTPGATPAPSLAPHGLGISIGPSPGTAPPRGATPGPGATPGSGPMPGPGMMPGPGAMPGSGQPPFSGADPAAPGPHPYTAADLTKLVETIIEALGCNSSALARSTLEQVLAGTFATDDDKTAVEATLKTLLAHSSEENDALIVRVLSAASALRSADHQGPWTAKEMETKAFELVKQSASLGFRAKLATAALAGPAGFDPKDSTTEFLLTADPLNCSAQLLFYEKIDARRNKELRTTLEQQIANYSSAAMARCLGISTDGLPASPGAPANPIGPVMPAAPGGARPAGAQPGAMTPLAPGGRGTAGPPPPRQPPQGRPFAPAGPAPAGPAMPFGPPAAPMHPGEPVKAVDADLGPQLAAQLWSEQFRAVIEPQVAELHPLDKQPQLIVLAATIPEDSTRAALARLLHKRWGDGPKALETAGLTDRLITDPGLLPIIKMSGARKESPSTPKAADAAASRRGGRSPAPAAPAGGARSEAAQKARQAEQDWMDVSAKLASGWCKRFSAAPPVKSAGESSDKAAGEAGDTKLPEGIVLRSGAKVVASRHVVLPSAAPAGFSQAQPSALEVHYVRIEETAKPTSALSHYSRQAFARPADAHVFEGRTWIDSHRPSSQHPDRLRSVDILMTRPEAPAPAGPPEKGKKKAVEEEADLTIEILVIQIKDPSKE